MAKSIIWFRKDDDLAIRFIYLYLYIVNDGYPLHNDDGKSAYDESSDD